MLCNPTNVAAANCHALSPVSSHFGEGKSMGLSAVAAGPTASFTETVANSPAARLKASDAKAR